MKSNAITEHYHRHFIDKQPYPNPAPPGEGETKNQSKTNNPSERSGEENSQAAGAKNTAEYVQLHMDFKSPNETH